MRRAVMLSVAAALILAACGEGAAPQVEEAGRLLPENRLDLPEFDFPKYQALIGELRGTPVVVNIWGAWCPPCRVEAPGLARIAREFEGEVQFVGVDILDDREAARQFILEFDWPYPSVFDPDAEIRDRLGYIGQPVTIVYDREGSVAFEWVGPVTEGQLREELSKVL